MSLYLDLLGKQKVGNELVPVDQTVFRKTHLPAMVDRGCATITNIDIKAGWSHVELDTYLWKIFPKAMEAASAAAADLPSPYWFLIDSTAPTKPLSIVQPSLGFEVDGNLVRMY